MQIITLTSDLGLKDYFVASVKARLLREIPSAHCIDISHQIKPFDSIEAAFQLRSCFDHFPKGTLHLVGVDCEPYLPYKLQPGQPENALIYPCIMEFQDQYIVCSDNGFIGAFLGTDVPKALYRYRQIEEYPEQWNFMLKNCFIGLAKKIIEKKPIQDFCESVTKFKRAFTPIPQIEHNLIIGNVIHIDSFGNIITNIFKSDFERFGPDVPFTISYQKRNDDIDTISKAYNDVAMGDRVAIFNEEQRLEIAINRGANAGSGGADRLFGIRLGESVRVTFFPRGSVQKLSSLL
ncbi:MAG: S-adenosyl-l-methionine hydroxide adenosyltransferase family protein [Bacteroidota bacterium]